MSETMMSPATCFNCHGKVSRRGPTPASGRRYCMQEACQKAKYRAREEGRRPAHRDEWAPEVCASCGERMQPRRKLRTDSPAGRFCKRLACQEDRERREAAYDVDRLKLERDVFESSTDFALVWVQRLMSARDSEDGLDGCPECGGRGLTGWVHPNAASASRPCAHLGERPISRATATLISPAFRQMVESTQS